ncbi:hypothetical protein LOD99_1611 [Oopsacas minuta]|uniref:TIR domain-containing protein n=1 Tax=Oopsacas minuta TaxID=111878 RepID=A0AAV7K3P9_9METZ|nr:hypothetical protein LOD99_1611 [Oopsacas minuta]
MKNIIFALFLLYPLSITGYQIEEATNRNKVFLSQKNNDCSSKTPIYDAFKNASLTFYCPFKPIEWIYRTNADWKYEFQINEKRDLNFTIEVKSLQEGCVCCRSIIYYTLACIQLKINSAPILNYFYPYVTATYCDEPFEIVCPFTGYPQMNYTWVFYYDNNVNQTEVNLPAMKGQTHNEVLHFDKYSTDMRSGTFHCTAENEYGIGGKSTADNGRHARPRFQLSAPQECVGYNQYFASDLSQEYKGSIGGNVTMSCSIQYACQFPQDCLDYIKWDDSLFPPDRTVKANISSCSRCAAIKNRTIFNIEASDFNKIYSCTITKPRGYKIFHYNTTLKTASQNIQSFNPIPALLPTTIILIALTILTISFISLGIYYKKNITMFFYYRLAKEPPYVKGLKYDAFISFASLDKDFVEEKIHNRVNNAGYKVIWYPDDFPAGGIILQEAKDSIWKSRKTILCLSENFLRSDYCKAEKDFCFEKAMETFKNFLIIIHLDNCEIPSDMKKLKIIEMSLQGNQARAFSNLKYLLKAPVNTVVTN